MTGEMRAWLHHQQPCLPIVIYHPRVLFGSNHLYVFHHPQELSYLAKTGEQPKPVTYDSAQGEIAAGSGFDMTTEGKSKGHYHNYYINNN